MNNTVTDLLKKYSQDIDVNDEQKRSKLEILKDLISGKDWDSSPCDIPLLLIYEYSTSLEVLSGISYIDIAKKLTTIMEKFRLGNWKAECGDHIVEYDNLSVLSDEFIQKYRNSFGAQTIDYINDNNELHTAVILYDGKNGNGINLDSLNDIRHTAFHEWTHVMELCKSDNLEETVFCNNGRVFHNDQKKANGEVWTTGISTREFGENSRIYSAGNRIMHNQITEGFVEIILRKIMENVIGKEETKKEIDLTRYVPHLKVAQTIMNTFGEKKTIATFITHSNQLIENLDSITINGRDALHYMSDFINDQKHFGKIPEYSPRTKLFSKMEKLIDMLGISIENVPTIQKEWEQAELDGCASEVVREILLKYKTKELSSEELSKFETFIAIYKNLLLNETKFYDTLETLLKPQQFVGDDR